jgi:hypothetical protein
MAKKSGVPSYTITGRTVLILSDPLPNIPPLTFPFTAND